MCDRSYFEQLGKIFFLACNHFAVIIEGQAKYFVICSKRTLVIKVLTYWMPKFFDQYSRERGTGHMDFFSKTAKKFQLFIFEHERFRTVCLHCIQITLFQYAFHHSFIKTLSKIFRSFRYALTTGVQIRSDWSSWWRITFLNTSPPGIRDFA